LGLKNHLPVEGAPVQYAGAHAIVDSHLLRKWSSFHSTGLGNLMHEALSLTKLDSADSFKGVQCLSSTKLELKQAALEWLLQGYKERQ